MALADMAMGVNNAIQQQLARRLQEQAIQRQIAQQQIENSQRDRGLAIQESAANARETPRPIEMSPGGSLVDPTTGRIIASIPEKAAPPERPISLAPGGSLVDPGTGRIIAQIPDRPAAPKEPHRVIQQGIGPDGKPTFISVDLDNGRATPVQMPTGYGPNRPAKPVTPAERQTLAFYKRMQDAVDLIEKGDKPLEDQIANQGLLGQYQGQMAPNVLQSGPQQMYRQAQRAYTEARLRKESGAAIPESEFANDARTYFVQPGDSPEVIKQKRVARQSVLAGLKNSAGKAYEEFYGGADDGGAPAAGATEYDWVDGKLVPRK